MFRRQFFDSQTPRVVKSAFTSSYIAEASLFKSSPDPSMFGNGPNPPSAAAQQAKGWTHSNWLLSRFHFSFAEYQGGADRSNFGPLRVMNDDLVQPQRMFGEHGHRDAEIATLVLEGQLTHSDSMGNVETLGRNSIQYMSAGRGVRHSEGNNSPSAPLRFIQMWFTPRRSGLAPQYGSLSGANCPGDVRKNRFFHMICDAENPEAGASLKNVPIKLHTDVNLYVAEIDAGSSVEFPINAGRAIYVLCCEGKAATANIRSGGDSHSQTLNRHDAMTVCATNATVVEFKSAADSASYMLVVEVKNPEKDSRQ